MKNNVELSQVVDELSVSGQYVLEAPLVRPNVDPKKEAILKNISIELYEFFVNHLVPERYNVSIIDTVKREEIRQLIQKNTRSIINLGMLNKVQYINKFLIKLNSCMPDAGIFIGCVEPSKNVKERYRKKIKIPFLFSLFWVFVFLFHRVMPKVAYLQKIYFFLTKGKYRYLTMGETLGRVVSCGFEIIEYKEIEGLLYFAVIKTGEPTMGVQPSFGPFFPMTRIGKNGQIIKVYKLRTMHPFAEFLQEFVTKLNGYNKEGKPANDFRVASWGKFYRKYWIDELPQLINVLKGDLNIVGVRPLSRARFNELP